MTRLLTFAMKSSAFYFILFFLLKCNLCYYTRMSFHVFADTLIIPAIISGHLIQSHILFLLPPLDGFSLRHFVPTPTYCEGRAKPFAHSSPRQYSRLLFQLNNLLVSALSLHKRPTPKDAIKLPLILFLWFPLP